MNVRKSKVLGLLSRKGVIKPAHLCQRKCRWGRSSLEDLHFFMWNSRHVSVLLHMLLKMLWIDFPLETWHCLEQISCSQGWLWQKLDRKQRQWHLLGSPRAKRYPGSFWLCFTFFVYRADTQPHSSWVSKSAFEWVSQEVMGSVRSQSWGSTIA